MKILIDSLICDVENILERDISPSAKEALSHCFEITLKHSSNVKYVPDTIGHVGPAAGKTTLIVGDHHQEIIKHLQSVDFHVVPLGKNIVVEKHEGFPIIAPPPIPDIHFVSDDGQTNRRERRKKQRKNKR